MTGTDPWIVSIGIGGALAVRFDFHYDDGIMRAFDIVALILALCAVLGYLNHRFIKLPNTIGLMVGSLGVSILIIGVSSMLPLDAQSWGADLLAKIDFSETLLKGVLSLILFAGALEVDIEDLSREKWVVGTLATAGVLISAATVGALVFGALRVVGIELSFIYCLVFGALISPTDPIAVLSMLKRVKVPSSLQTQIAGESLFNDGVAVVLFAVLLEIATGEHGVSVEQALLLLAREAAGGGCFRIDHWMGNVPADPIRR